MKPLLILDAFCGAGGAAAGYWQALSGNAMIVGVDIEYQKNYPFHFVRGDAIAFIRQFGYLFDFIHASPPCQFASNATPNKSNHYNFIPATRTSLISSRKPYVIENVAGAKNHLLYPVMLCGAALGLKVYRHRLFECSLPVTQPAHFRHNDDVPSAGHYSRNGDYCISSKGFISIAGHFTNIDYARSAMAIDWMGQNELAQAIPPPMTQYIGAQVFSQIGYETIAPELNVPIQLSLFDSQIRTS